MAKQKKKVGDFRHRTAKIGEKLAPANETRIEVKFRSIDVVRGHGASAAAAIADGSASADAAASLHEALVHTRHHAVLQRREAVLAVRGLLASSPALVLASAADVIPSLAERLTDVEAPVRALAMPVLASLFGSLHGDAARTLLPLVSVFLCSALARPHTGTRLDAVGAAALLAGAAPDAAGALLPTVAPALVGLLEPALHAAGGSSATLAASSMPPSYAIDSSNMAAVAGGGGGGGASSSAAAAAAGSRKRVGGRESRLAITYVLRRLLLGAKDGSVGDASVARGVDTLPPLLTTPSSAHVMMMMMMKDHASSSHRQSPWGVTPPGDTPPPPVCSIAQNDPTTTTTTTTLSAFSSQAPLASAMWHNDSLRSLPLPCGLSLGGCTLSGAAAGTLAVMGSGSAMSLRSLLALPLVVTNAINDQRGSHAPEERSVISSAMSMAPMALAVSPQSSSPGQSGVSRHPSHHHLPPLPLPLACEALGQLIGLWLEGAPSEAHAAPSHELHRSALLIHTMTLLTTSASLLHVSAMPFSTLSLRSHDTASTAASSSGAPAFSLSHMAGISGFVAAHGSSGNPTLPDSAVLRRLLSSSRLASSGAPQDPSSDANDRELDAAYAASEPALAGLALRALSLHVLPHFPVRSSDVASGAGGGGGRARSVHDSGAAASSAASFARGLLNTRLAELTATLLPPVCAVCAIQEKSDAMSAARRGGSGSGGAAATATAAAAAAATVTAASYAAPGLRGNSFAALSYAKKSAPPSAPPLPAPVVVRGGGKRARVEDVGKQQLQQLPPPQQVTALQQQQQRMRGQVAAGRDDVEMESPLSANNAPAAPVSIALGGGISVTLATVLRSVSTFSQRLSSLLTFIEQQLCAVASITAARGGGAGAEGRSGGISGPSSHNNDVSPGDAAAAVSLLPPILSLLSGIMRHLGAGGDALLHARGPLASATAPRLQQLLSAFSSVYTSTPPSSPVKGACLSFIQETLSTHRLPVDALGVSVYERSGADFVGIGSSNQHSVVLTDATARAWITSLPRLLWALGPPPPASDDESSLSWSSAFTTAVSVLQREARCCVGASRTSPRAVALREVVRSLTPLLYTTKGGGGQGGGGGEPHYGSFRHLPQPLALAVISVMSSTGGHTPPFTRAAAVLTRCPRVPFNVRSALCACVVECALEDGAVHRAGLPVGGGLHTALEWGGSSGSGSSSTTPTPMLDPGAASSVAFLLALALGCSTTVSALASAPQVLMSSLPPTPADRGVPLPSTTTPSSDWLTLVGLSEGDDAAYDAALHLACSGLRRTAGAAVGGAPAVFRAVRDALTQVCNHHSSSSSSGGIDSTSLLTSAFAGGGDHAILSLRSAAALASLLLCTVDVNGSGDATHNATSPPLSPLGKHAAAALCVLLLRADSPPITTSTTLGGLLPASERSAYASLLTWAPTLHAPAAQTQTKRAESNASQTCERFGGGALAAFSCTDALVPQTAAAARRWLRSAVLAPLRAHVCTAAAEVFSTAAGDGGEGGGKVAGLIVGAARAAAACLAVEEGAAPRSQAEAELAARVRAAALEAIAALSASREVHGSAAIDALEACARAAH